MQPLRFDAEECADAHGQCEFMCGMLHVNYGLELWIEKLWP